MSAQGGQRTTEAAMARRPDEGEVLRWFETLSNWGRWGDEDERGTLNLITAEARRKAARLVREGISVSCGWDLDGTWMSGTIQRHMMRTGEGLGGTDLAPRASLPLHDFGGRGAFAAETLNMVFHQFGVTHVDALSHIFWDGRMYNGRPASLVTASLGATANAVTGAREGVFTRGVLVDVPSLRGVDWLEGGDGVFPEDLEAAEAQLGLRVGEGDALLVRTGAGRRIREEGLAVYAAAKPGLQAACLPWLRDRGVAVTATDSSNDVLPSGYGVVTTPMHSIGITALGLCEVDSCDFEELVATCERLGRWEFLFGFAALRVVGGTGSPVNPIVTF